MHTIRSIWATMWTSIPFYVTRENAGGIVATWSIAAVWGLLVLFLTTFNIIAWGIVGLIAAVNAL